MQKVKVKNGQLYDISNCFLSLIDASEEMSGKLHYAIDKNLKVLEPIIQELQLKRQTIVEKDCDKDENGNPVLVENENKVKEYQYSDSKTKEETTKKYNELMGQDCEINIYKIPLSLYNDCRLNTKKVLNTHILFDIIIDENK